ncbi:MAG TPA: nickel pincer cofactor biosynthesis protein LarC [Planctomycetota bacterium]
MRLVHLDPFSGLAGDMLVGALLDAGAPPAALERVLASLPQEFTAEIGRELRHGISGTRFRVAAQEGHVHRHLADVVAILRAADLTPRALAWAEAAFQALAEAEGRCHDKPAEAVHFHEVGAVDAIVDVAAACALMDSLDPAEIWCGPVAVGSGFVDCAHGRMPVPAPGTLRLLEGMPTCGEDLLGERTTPTGAALLRGWKVRFGTRPPAVVETSGYGVGGRDPADAPNLLRVVIERAEGGAESLLEFRALVDDRSGEVIGAALDSARAAGAIEAFAVPAWAKKGRPAFEIVVLAPSAERGRFEELLFRELGTLGMRVQVVTRVRHPRRIEERDTPLGKLPFKVRSDAGGAESAKPEFEALRVRAAELGLTTHEALARLAHGPHD